MYLLAAHMGFYGFIVTFCWSAAGSRNIEGGMHGITKEEHDEQGRV